MADRAQLESALGYSFNDPTLLANALTHRSFSAQNNERLEFLGDALLGCITAEALFHASNTFREGDLSQFRSSLVKGKTLAVIARSIDLGQYLVMGEGERKTGGENKASMLANALEAVIAAVYLDSDFARTKRMVLALFEHQWQLLLNSKDSQKDAKTQLQEYRQAQKKPLPVYRLSQVDGADHQQVFTVHCCLAEIHQPFAASGPNRRQAEKDAARKALNYLHSL